MTIITFFRRIVLGPLTCDAWPTCNQYWLCVLCLPKVCPVGFKLKFKCSLATFWVKAHAHIQKYLELQLRGVKWRCRCIKGDGKSLKCIERKNVFPLSFNAPPLPFNASPSPFSTSLSPSYCLLMLLHCLLTSLHRPLTLAFTDDLLRPLTLFYFPLMHLHPIASPLTT